MSDVDASTDSTLLRLGGRELAPGLPCLVIGEVAQAHDGSLGQAHAFIDAIANTGADAVKFQTHIAAAESTAAEPWRVKFSRQDATRYDYWKRMEFTEEQWTGLKAHADDAGLLFLSSPFSVEAAEMLRRVGTPGWKLASGELGDAPLVEHLLATGLPMLVSTGMSPWAEIDDVVERVRSAGSQLAVMQCTTEYPVPPEDVGLNLVGEMRARYGCPVGLSDHSGTVYPALAAAALGIELIEVHVALSKDMFGPDVPASITPGELGTLVAGVRYIESMRSNPVDKDAFAQRTQALRETFGRSVVARTDLPAGAVLDRDSIAAKKPGTGLPASRISELLGRRLVRDVRADEQLRLEDVE